MKNGVFDLIVDGANHLEPEIRSRKPGNGDVGIHHPQLADDVRLDVLGCGSGECEDRRAAQSLGDCAEGEIVRPEVVAPLTDAVRFVDDEKTYGAGKKMV